ncbi:TIR domain-containing protein [Novosphingobium sp. ZW T3_23]|uniref:TIR domain-containing protein n=1 Tax=Novosphingobium sp. ZW T3_23 TaxID=3378084 RepID=UPI0038555A68
MDNQNLIFLSYASPDRDAVLRFHDDLASAGYNVWMDKHRLKGGQNWDFEIKKALQQAVIIVVFLSGNSVDRRGYAQREIKIALDQANDRLVDDIYLIPLLLESDTPIPDQLSRIQAIGVDDHDPRDALKDAITHQLGRLGVETAKAQAEANLRWTMTTYRDAWEGLPGYEVSYQLPHFSSLENPQVGEITDVVRGWLQSQAMAQREVKFSQSSELFNFGEKKFSRQNTWESACNEPIIKGGVLSLIYSIWWYGAKAMHPNQYFATFCFSINPVTQFRSLEELFENADEAFLLIQSQCREQLLAMNFDEMTNDNTELRLDKGYVEDGTKEWSDFGSFALREDGINVLFSTYQVAPYAFGPQSAHISYEVVAPMIRKEMACLLGIEHLQSKARKWPFGAETPEAATSREEDGLSGASPVHQLETKRGLS